MQRYHRHIADKVARVLITFTSNASCPSCVRAHILSPRTFSRCNYVRTTRYSNLHSNDSLSRLGFSLFLSLFSTHSLTLSAFSLSSSSQSRFRLTYVVHYLLFRFSPTTKRWIRWRTGPHRSVGSFESTITIRFRPMDENRLWIIRYAGAVRSFTNNGSGLRLE